MPRFEEILKSSSLTYTVTDTEWMRETAEMIRDLDDPYLVEMFRLTFMACAIRLAGEQASFEGIDFAKLKVLELLKESLSVEST